MYYYVIGRYYIIGKCITTLSGVTTLSVNVLLRYRLISHYWEITSLTVATCLSKHIDLIEVAATRFAVERGDGEGAERSVAPSLNLCISENMQNRPSI
jgi:hypothetical protein